MRTASANDGAARRAALLKAFGSLDAVAAAGADEIAKRAHVSRTLALRIADHLGHGAGRPAGGPP